MKKMRWLLVLATLLAPASLTAGPRVDFTGRWCSRCCDTWCPFDRRGMYTSCLPDLGLSASGTHCEYSDRHFLWVGGCD